jgi:peptide/nickel transport system permease protein
MASASVVTARAHGAALGQRSLLRRTLRQPAGAFGLGVVAVLTLLVAFAPLIAPYAADAQDIPSRLQGPSWNHLLGTDQLGRDLLSRLIFGVRVELAVAVPAVAAALGLGLALGLVSGYLAGKVDAVVLVIMDTLQALPAVILALTILALLGPSQRNVAIVVGIAFAPGFARVARALVFSVKQNPFIEVERSLGASDLRIILVHILPNVVAPLFVLLAMNLPSAIAVEAGLSFLGLGVPPPTPSWGVILADGFERIRDTPWAVVWTGLTLMITTLGFTLLGETLRDLIDPRLAGARR